MVVRGEEGGVWDRGSIVDAAVYSRWAGQSLASPPSWLAPLQLLPAAWGCPLHLQSLPCSWTRRP